MNRSRTRVTMRRSKRTARRLFGTAVFVGAIVACLGVVLARDDADTNGEARVRFVRNPPPSAPAETVSWWAPVHGEPLGVAVDGDDVAAAALDEVRLLDARTGLARWKASVPGVRRYRPAIGGGLVAASSERDIVVLDRSDGARVATVPFSGPGPASVLADASGAPIVVAGSETGMLTAAAPGSDAARWSVSYPGAVTVAPRGEAGLVVASWHDEPGAVLRAFDASTGAVRWEVALGPMASAPALAPGTVIVADGRAASTARVRALDLRTGRDRWQVDVRGWFEDELEAAVDATTVYVLDGMGSVVALDLATGTVRWRTDTGRPLVDGRVVLTSQSVVFASYDDELMVLDRATGRLRAAEPQSGVPVDVAEVDDRLVVALRLGSPSRIEARPVP